jgi:KAP-like P-loop domain-containing protein
MKNKSKKLILLPDTPIAANALDPFFHDLLGFKESVIKIAPLLLHISTPFTIGVYGDWGSGKTSFMNMLSAYLAKESNLKTFWFNAWEYENETSLLLPLLSKLANEIDNKSELFDSIKKIASAVVLTGSNILLKAATLNTINIDEIEKNLKLYEEQVGKTYEKWVSDIDELRSQFKNLVDKICKDSSSLVIFIDDLDRCLPENVIKLIENIKHLLSVKGCNCIFVIGVDKEVLSSAIKARYGAEIIGGDEYLEKIINLSLHVPRYDNEISKTYIINKLKSQANEDWYKEVEHDVIIFADILSDVGVTNPRKTKILITRYLFYLAFKDEINFMPDIIVRLILYKEFFPDAYRMKEEENDVNYFPFTHGPGVPIGASLSFEEIAEKSCKDFAIINKEAKYKPLAYYGRNIN